MVIKTNYFRQAFFANHSQLSYSKYTHTALTGLVMGISFTGDQRWGINILASYPLPARYNSRVGRKLEIKHMLDMGFEAFTIALLQIIAIDIILGGDNAIVIALACRNLPAHQKRAGILWGTAGAIVLRVILIFFASTLMTTPGLRLIGGLLLLWIGVKLITEETGDDLDGKIKQNTSLIGAIRTIIIADFVMSLDNALAITAASKGNMFLVVFGLVLSVPIIIGGSAIILRIMERFPVVIVLGGGLLGWLGGDLIATDKMVTGYLKDMFSTVPQMGAIVGAVLVVAIGKLIQIATRRRMAGHDPD